MRSLSPRRVSRQVRNKKVASSQLLDVDIWKRRALCQEHSADRGWCSEPGNKGASLSTTFDARTRPPFSSFSAEQALTGGVVGQFGFVWYLAIVIQGLGAGPL